MPIPPQWSNYVEATRFIPFFNYIKNSAMYCALTILGALFSNSLVAYSFARLDWPFKKFGFLLTLSMMMIPFQVTMIPLFLMMHKLGWANTYLPLVVPHFFGNAFFIFLLRQFFMTIPEEYSSCARIDGAGELMIFAWIIIPQCKAALSVVALFQFIDAWRDFLGPLIYLNDESKFPISLGIQQFCGDLLQAGMGAVDGCVRYDYGSHRGSIRLLSEVLRRGHYSHRAEGVIRQSDPNPLHAGSIAFGRGRGAARRMRGSRGVSGAARGRPRPSAPARGSGGIPPCSGPRARGGARRWP